MVQRGAVLLDGGAQESLTQECLNLSPEGLIRSQPCEDFEENFAALSWGWGMRGRVLDFSLVLSTDTVWEDARLLAGLWGDPSDGCPLDVGEWHHRCLPAAWALHL